MKNHLFILIAAGIGLSACSKSAKVKPAAVSSFSATVNGATENFTFNDTVRAINSFSFYLSGTNQATSDRVMIYAYASSGDFRAGTFTSDQSSGIGATQVFFKDGSVSAGADGYGGYYYSYPYANGVDYLGTINYTTVTDSVIEGTFNGNLIAERSVLKQGTLATKTLTNGKFKIFIKSLQN